MAEPIKNLRIEFPRRHYIRLLTEFALDSKFIPKDESDIQLTLELQKEGYLSGTAVHTMQAPSVHFIDPGITVNGRLFLQKLEKDEKDDSVWGKFKKHLDSSMDIIIGVIIGITVPIAVDILKELLGITK